MQPRAERYAAFVASLKNCEIPHLQQVATYLRQQIEQRERAVAMVGVSTIVAELKLIETNSQPPLANIVQALWMAVDHVPLQRAWLHNETTRPILRLVVNEAHVRQGLAASEAGASLNVDIAPGEPPREQCYPQPTPTEHRLARWFRSLRRAS